MGDHTLNKEYTSAAVSNVKPPGMEISGEESPLLREVHLLGPKSIYN
jgi:hypothetical protein